ncbi:MAG: flagellin FliC [Firmicutes bacterium]|nr:flagellin FliC [Bacillota bacterium]
MRINMTSDSFETTARRVSTGQRINRAADDPAGLAISEKMRSQTRGLSQAIRNSQDRISMLQVKDSALSSVNGSLQQIRELKLQAENGTYTAEDRAAINDQIDQLKADISSTVSTSSYNEQKLIDGALGENQLESIGDVDRAMDSVSSQRSEAGAEQNRLEHEIKNEMVAHENLTAAESNIRDTDIARQMMERVKNDIMEQADILLHSNLNRKNALMLLTD